MKIGIYGGSFNPIHNTHLAIVKESLERRLVDEVWLLPCKNHAFNKSLVDSSYRVDMINLAIENIPNAKVDLTEVNATGKNYTIDTIRQLKRKYKHNFSLIVGEDIIDELPNWNRYQQLLREVSWIVFTPKNYHLQPLEGMNLDTVVQTDLGFSRSTLIRERLQEGLPITELVPKKVAEYITKNGLYC